MDMTLNWSARFVGIPFSDLGRNRSGADCFGLVKVVYREALGIELPDYLGAYVSTQEKAEVAALIDDVTATPTWQPVTDARPFDVCVFRIGRLGSHLGLHVVRGLMLHVPENGQSRIEDYTAPRWASLLAGCYRHEASPS